MNVRDGMSSTRDSPPRERDGLSSARDGNMFPVDS